MQAFHCDPTVKATYLTRVRYHQQQGHLVKKYEYYIHRSTGRLQVCAVGATLHDPEGGHDRYPEVLGIPESLAFLEEVVFDNAWRPYSLTWPSRFLEAIGLGADLRGVPYHLALWLLTSPDHGFWHAATERGRQAIAPVADLLRRRIAGEQIMGNQWGDAATDALRLFKNARPCYSADQSAAGAAFAATRHAYPYWLSETGLWAVDAHIRGRSSRAGMYAQNMAWQRIGDQALARFALAPPARGVQLALMTAPDADASVVSSDKAMLVG